MTYTGTKLDDAIAEVRTKMQLTDPVALQTVQLAEDYARHMRALFVDRDLQLVAEAVLFSGGSTGYLMQISGPIQGMAAFALNVQSVAAVLILDELAMAEAERGHP